MAALLNIIHMCLRCVDVSLHNVWSDKEENVKMSKSKNRKKKKKNEQEMEREATTKKKKKQQQQLEFMYKKRGITSILT